VVSRRAFLAFVLLASWRDRAFGQNAVPAMRFSALRPGAALPPEYQPYTFEGRPRHTEYALVSDSGRTVLRARAEGSTSGIIRELRVEPAMHPILAWRWKVTRVLEKSDLATKEGDDFPARLYVTFDLDPSVLSLGERLQIGLARLVYGPKTPVAALCYVWDSRARAGTVVPNAYTDRVRMVVVESGAANLGRWMAYERDVAADFRAAFGLEPPAVSSVIVSTDTDNTGEFAETYYGDAEFRARPPS
jgi:hypothetical protein